jgi:hypothetical protein
MSRVRKRQKLVSVDALPEIFSEDVVSKIFRDSVKRQGSFVDVVKLREHILIGMQIYISEASEISISESAEELKRVAKAAAQMKLHLVFKNWNRLSEGTIQIAERCCGRPTVLSDTEVRSLMLKDQVFLNEEELKNVRRVCKELLAVCQAVTQQADAIRARDKFCRRAPRRRDAEFILMLNVELGLMSSTKREIVRFYAARQDQSPLARVTIACLKLVGSRGVTVRHLIESRRQLLSSKRKMGPNWWTFAMSRQGISMAPRMHRGAG